MLLKMVSNKEIYVPFLGSNVNCVSVAEMTNLIKVTYMTIGALLKLSQN